MNNLTKISVAGACLMVNAFAYAAGQASANYAIPRDTINNGVAEMASTNYRLAASVGDAVATGAIGSVGFQLSNGFRATVNASPAVLNLLSVVSRKFHGATSFSLSIDKNAPITGNITIEPRAIGAGHTLIFHFDSAVTSVAAATALDALSVSAGTATVAAVSGDVVVTLTNVADNKRLTIALSGLNGTGTALASMGFLVGDVTNTRSVNAADVAAVKANAGRTPLDNTTFKFDLNANGTITSSDISAVKARSGLVIP